MRKGESKKYGTGTSHTNNDGDTFVVLDYRTCTDVDIKFDCEDVVRTARAHYLENTKLKMLNIAKSLKNDIHPNVYNLLLKYDWENL